MGRAQEIDIQIRGMIALFTVTTASLFGSVAAGYIALINGQQMLLWGCSGGVVMCSLIDTALALILMNRAKKASEV